MIYIENVYFCLAAPLLLACFCCEKKLRNGLVFVLCGMTACLFSAYINAFFAQAYGTSVAIAAVEIAPLIEEVVKLLPVLFYLIVFVPRKKQAFSVMLMVAIGFASFENICYLVEHGAENLQNILLRGVGTGAMHLVCGAIVGYGLLFTWDKKWLRVVGSFGVLCIAIVYHAEYNLLMSGGALAQDLGAMLPIATFAVALLFKKQLQNILE